MCFWPGKTLGSSTEEAGWEQVNTGWSVRKLLTLKRGDARQTFPWASFPHPSSSSLLSAMTPACPVLRGLGYINISSSLKMPPSQLWCPLGSSSHRRVSCGGSCTATSQGQQLSQANDSNSVLRLALGWNDPVKHAGQHQCETWPEP